MSPHGYRGGPAAVKRLAAGGRPVGGWAGSSGLVPVHSQERGVPNLGKSMLSGSCFYFSLTFQTGV